MQTGYQSLHGVVDVDMYLQVLETCRPFYSLGGASSTARSLPPRLDDALQDTMLVESMKNMSPVVSETKRILELVHRVT